MAEVRIIDENGFYTGESKFVEEILENMATTHLSVGYVKPKWNGEEWIEGATEKEIQAWKEKQIDICLDQTKTNEQLTVENNQLWETVEFLLKQVELIPKEVV